MFNDKNKFCFYKRKGESKMIIRINVDIFDSDEEIVKNEVMKFIRRLSYSGREIDYNFEISTINGTKKSENIYKKREKYKLKNQQSF